MARKKAPARTAPDEQNLPPSPLPSEPEPILATLPGAEPTPQTFTPQECGTLWKVLGELEVRLVSKLMKIPPPLAKQIFAYDEKDLEQLSEPSAKVLNKHVTGWMRDRKDELVLLMAVVAVHQRKFFTLYSAVQAAKQREQQQQAAETNSQAEVA